MNLEITVALCCYTDVTVWRYARQNKIFWLIQILPIKHLFYVVTGDILYQSSHWFLSNRCPTAPSSVLHDTIRITDVAGWWQIIWTHKLAWVSWLQTRTCILIAVKRTSVWPQRFTCVHLITGMFASLWKTDPHTHTFSATETCFLVLLPNYSLNSVWFWGCLLIFKVWF